MVVKIKNHNYSYKGIYKTYILGLIQLGVGASSAICDGALDYAPFEWKQIKLQHFSRLCNIGAIMLNTKWWYLSFTWWIIALFLHTLERCCNFMWLNSKLDCDTSPCLSTSTDFIMVKCHTLVQFETIVFYNIVYII